MRILSDTLRDADKLIYDVTWGGMISRGVDDSEDIDPNANFGFVTYNDHHFHLGYWVYAMAYYVQFYPQWGVGKTKFNNFRSTITLKRTCALGFCR